MEEITGWHVLVTIMAVALITAFAAYCVALHTVDNQYYQIKNLEYRLYELNLKETRLCYDKATYDPACYDPVYQAFTDCPQVKACNHYFETNELYYKDW